jgi:hypothetical protein
MVADVLDRFRIVGKKDLYPNSSPAGSSSSSASLAPSSRGPD